MNLLHDYALYNLWANTKVCADFLSGLDESTLDKEIKSSFPSLRKTVYHIWDAEVIWLNRLTGGDQTVLPIVHEPMNFAGFSVKFLSHSKRFADFVGAGNEELFNKKLTYINTEGKEFTNLISDIIHHVMNHGTYHRGQIVTMLREAGFTELSSTDFITWRRLKG